MVKLRKVDDKTTGGLFVPTTEIEKPKEGTIVLAGPGKANPETGALIDCPVKDGDLVMLSDDSGEKVDYNNEQHIFTDADTLLGYFEDQALAIKAFRPLGDLLMVAVADMEQETSTGIALAGLEEEEGNSGEVVATGPGRRLYNGDLVPCETKPGDSVMYTSRMGQEATLEGKRFIIVSEQDCLCKW